MKFKIFHFDIDVIVKISFKNGQGVRSNSSVCSGYQMRNHGEWVNMYCADRLHWIAKLSICDWPANVACTLPESPAEVAQLKPSP